MLYEVITNGGCLALCGGRKEIPGRREHRQGDDDAQIEPRNMNDENADEDQHRREGDQLENGIGHCVVSCHVPPSRRRLSSSYNFV